MSEGEVWWRLSAVPALGHPSLTFHSRYDVVPLLHGRDVLACAFVSRLENPNPTADGGPEQDIYRHFEIHDGTTIANVLFRGRRETLGRSVPLTQHIDTAELPEVWRHDMGMLAGRIVNRWGKKPLVGRSIYAGVWPRMLALNEATTVGRENMRLTAKKRVVVGAAAVRSNGLPTSPDDPRVQQAIASGAGIPIQAPTGPRFDAGEDVIVDDPLDAEEGGARDPYRVLEYSFEAEQLIAWLKFEIETVCQRCDVVPQFIGSGDFGTAESGTALKVRLLPTDNAAEGRGRAWDDQLPVISMRGQLLEAADVQFGGLGRSEWALPGDPPSVERSSSLPEDENEVAQRHATLKTVDLISTQQSIEERHPDWDEEQVLEEVDRIRADVSNTMPAITPFGAGGAPEENGPTPPEPPGQQ